MKPRALESATADLFAAAVPAARRPVPALGASAAAAQGCRAAAFKTPVVCGRVSAVGRCRRSQPPGCGVCACIAQRFTPLVSIEMPNALLLEISGSVKLFGSLEALHAEIDAAWSGLALEAQSATAPSTLAALWLARAGKRELIEDPGLLAGKLAELPVTCTSWDPEKLETLRAMGVTRIGELLRLPRAGLARRFGAGAVLDLDIALARQAAPRRAFVPRERFRERCDFETEVETAAYLVKALEPLTDRCARFLRERQAGVQALELRLKHRAAPVTRIRFGLASITSDRRRLTDVLVQKLSRVELAAPIVRMELLSGRLAAALGRFSRCLRRLERSAAAIRRRSWWSVCARGSASKRCMGFVRSPSIGPRRLGSGCRRCVSTPCCAPGRPARRTIS